MIQELAGFKQETTADFFKHFKKIPEEAFVGIACTATGSRIIEALITSNQIESKVKEAISMRTSHSLMLLATNKFGSHIVDKIYHVSGDKIMVSELLLF